tara:strand:- start:646 stop:972 length:327 start_codon:yes stop_codon:yes gene_type:complete
LLNEVLRDEEQSHEYQTLHHNSNLYFESVRLVEVVDSFWKGLPTVVLKVERNLYEKWPVAHHVDDRENSGQHANSHQVKVIVVFKDHLTVLNVFPQYLVFILILEDTD